MEVPPPPYTAPTFPRYATIGPDEPPLEPLPIAAAASSLPSASSDYEYSTDHMSLNLDRRVIGRNAPSYGKNAVIEGKLTVKSFKYVKEVTVTIWGKALLTVVDPILDKRCIFLMNISTVWSSSSDVPRPTTPQTYSISFPLPTHARDYATPLPPTMSTAIANVEVEVQYGIDINMIRQGFHRHEGASAVFLYLPRSIPTFPPRVSISFEALDAESETREAAEWRLTDGIPASKGPTNGTTLQLGLPIPLSYTAGLSVPFRITIISPSPSLTPAILKSILTVKLIHVLSITVAKPVRFNRALSTGQILKVEASANGAGIYHVTGSIKAGRPGGETSWALPHFVDMRYAVRLSMASTKNLPSYRCEEIVQLVTDEAQAFDLDSAQIQPALGLINQSTLKHPIF